MTTTEWLTTEQAAAVLGISQKALLMHISRGNIRPDSWGSRGRLKGHRWSHATLERFLRGERAA
jgi:hypothetical protein